MLFQFLHDYNVLVYFMLHGCGIGRDCQRTVRKCSLSSHCGGMVVHVYVAMGVESLRSALRMCVVGCGPLLCSKCTARIAAVMQSSSCQR